MTETGNGPCPTGDLFLAGSEATGRNPLVSAWDRFTPGSILSARRLKPFRAGFSIDSAAGAGKAEGRAREPPQAASVRRRYGESLSINTYLLITNIRK